MRTIDAAASNNHLGGSADSAPYMKDRGATWSLLPGPSILSLDLHRLP